MKSVNYSFNSSLLVDFMLLWHLKMEANQSSSPIRGRTQMHKSWWKADNALRTTFGHKINCLFIWQIPRRSMERTEGDISEANISWKRPNCLRV